MHKVLNPERFKEIKSKIRQRQKKLTGYAGTVLVESGTPLDYIPEGVKITTS